MTDNKDPYKIKSHDNVGVAPLEFNNDVLSNSWGKNNLLSNYM